MEYYNEKKWLESQFDKLKTTWSFIDLLELQKNVVYKKAWFEDNNTVREAKAVLSIYDNLLNSIQARINSIPAQPKQEKVSQKWYALLHMILIALGKENHVLYDIKYILPAGQDEPQGIPRGTGEGFYKTINEIDLNNMTAYIRSMSSKDRKNWKSIISKISGNDADIISWLKNQPN